MAFSTNRTNLELKHRKGQHILACAGTTNRTNLELKLVCCWAFWNTCTLPIAPIWNWNWKGIRWIHTWGCYQSHQSGIETQEKANQRWGYSLPIAPIWNWNVESSRYRRTWKWATNRTNLELKPGTQSQSGDTPTNPLWNWNLDFSFITWSGTFYQSPNLVET